MKEIYKELYKAGSVVIVEYIPWSLHFVVVFILYFESKRTIKLSKSKRVTKLNPNPFLKVIS